MFHWFFISISFENMNMYLSFDAAYIEMSMFMLKSAWRPYTLHTLNKKSLNGPDNSMVTVLQWKSLGQWGNFAVTEKKHNRPPASFMATPSPSAPPLLSRQSSRVTHLSFRMTTTETVNPVLAWNGSNFCNERLNKYSASEVLNADQRARVKC